MTQPPLATTPVDQTFLGVPASSAPIAGSVSILGAVHGTAYGHAASIATGAIGPDAVRRAITAASVHVDHWDFDFDGPLLNDGFSAFSTSATSAPRKAQMPATVKRSRPPHAMFEPGARSPS